MATDKLTDVAIRNAKPGPKPVRLADGGGLYLEVAPTGGKLWRWKFRFGGKEKRRVADIRIDRDTPAIGPPQSVRRSVRLPPTSFALYRESHTREAWSKTRSRR